LVRDNPWVFSRIPWYGKLLIGLSAIFLIGSIGFYGASITSGHTIDGSSSPSHRERYRWTGGELQLEATDRRDATTCFISGGGGQRTVHLVGTKETGTHRQNLGFTGDATVTCTRSVNAYTGSSVGRRDYSRSSAFRGTAVALIVVPLILIGVVKVLRVAARG
jgi:hypothetical protein